MATMNNDSKTNSLLTDINEIKKQLQFYDKSISSLPSIKTINSEVDAKLNEAISKLKKELKPQEQTDYSGDIKAIKNKVDLLDKKVIQIPDYSDDIKSISSKLKVIEGKQVKVESTIGKLKNTFSFFLFLCVKSL